MIGHKVSRCTRVRRGRAKTGTQNCWGKLALLALALAFCCLLLEGIARLCMGQRIVLYPRFHTGAVYGDYKIRRLRPSTVFRHRSVDGSWEFRTNSKGFRSDSESTYTKPAGVLRLICVGDSHTQGFECRQNKTYAATIRRYLQGRGIRAEVLNAGVSGFSTAEALVFIENEGIRYEPDAVVLGFFANDLDDNIKADLFRLEDGVLVNHRFEHAPAVGILDAINRWLPIRWLSQKSYAYSWAFNSLWEFKKRLLPDRARREAATEFAVGRRGGDAALLDGQEKLCEALIERLGEFCRRNGVLFVLLDIPQLGTAGTGMRSSVPPELEAPFRRSCDILVSGTTVVQDYAAVMDV